jgi:hypothetical protein
MINSISTLIASEHIADLQHEADRWRRTRAIRPSSAESASPVYALRLAHPDEAALVIQLAELDDAPALEGQTLLALRDGQVVAALSLSDGRIVATPFVPTSQASALLHLRAEQLVGPAQRRGWRARLHLHLRLA